MLASFRVTETGLCTLKSWNEVFEWSLAYDGVRRKGVLLLSIQMVTGGILAIGRGYI